MKLSRIVDWLDRFLDLKAFDDVSNNGVQIARRGEDVKLVAFAVDASVASVEKAAAAGAGLLVVHHGISWGGGVKRLTGGVYNVVKAAIDSDLAVYAAHLPLDANKVCGNNWELARYFALKDIKPAFSYHGNVIGVTGVNAQGRKIGVCSGGAGEFAPEAKALGCDLYVTGEASWGDRIAAENVGMPMVCGGHYETETFGVKGLAREMKKRLRIPVKFLGALIVVLLAAGPLFAGEAAFEEETYEFDRYYVGAAGTLVLPQGGGKMRRLGGAAARAGYYLTEMLAVEGEAAWAEDACGLAVRGLWHWWGYERLDPFFLFGAKGWINGDVGPDLGLGAFYHLTEALSLRADAEATLGLDTGAKMEYSLSLGLQYSF